MRLRLFSLLLLLCSRLGAQEAELDSLKQVLSTQKDDTNKVNTLFAMSEICAEEDILNYARQCYNLAVKLNYKKGITKACLNVGYGLNLKGEVDSSIAYFQKSLALALAINDKNTVSVACNNLGLVYSNQGLSEQALNFYLRGLSMQEDAHDDKGAAITLNNIGLIYADQDDQDKALEYYLRALEKSQALDDGRQVAYLYNNISSVYKEKKEYTKAIEVLDKGRNVLSRMGDNKGLAYAYNQLGQIEQLMGNTASAEDYFSKSLEHAKLASDKAGVSYALRNLASIYLEGKQLAKAESFCLQSVDMARQLGYPSMIANNSELMYRIYQAEGKFRQALDMHILWKQMSDSITRTEARQSTLKKEMLYNFNRKEAEAKAEQAKKDAVTKETRQRQQVIIYSVSGGLIMVLVFAIFIYRGYRQKKRSNVEIMAQKKLIEEKQKEILDSINYASRIQKALITSESYIHKALNKLKNKER